MDAPLPLVACLETHLTWSRDYIHFPVKDRLGQVVMSIPSFQDDLGKSRSKITLAFVRKRAEEKAKRSSRKAIMPPAVYSLRKVEKEEHFLVECQVSGVAPTQK